MGGWEAHPWLRREQTGGVVLSEELVQLSGDVVVPPQVVLAVHLRREVHSQKV